MVLLLYEFFFKIKVLKYRMMVMLNFTKFNSSIHSDVKKKNNFSFFVGLFTLLTVTFLYPVKETSDSAEKMDNVFMVFFPHYCLGKSIINIYVRYAKRLKCLHPNKHDHPTLTFFGGIHIFLSIFFKRKNVVIRETFLIQYKFTKDFYLALTLPFTSI